MSIKKLLTETVGNMKNTITQTFKGKNFEITVLPGTMHPGFAVHTFDEERDFVEKNWDIKEGDVVFDVGAAYGSYTLSALVSGASKVFSFEPEEKIHPNLSENVRINNWNDKCEVLPYGLWDKADNVDIKTYAAHYESQLTSPSYEMRTLDSYMDQCESINWLKIDVEGAEEQVIRGGLKAIAKFKPNLIIECHVFLDKELCNKIKQLILSVVDYEFEEIDRQPCIMLLAKPK